MLAEAVGRERIQVVHGTVDQMITVRHGEVLVKELGGEEQGVTQVIFKGKGHALLLEEKEEFNKVIAGFVEKTEAF